MLVEQFVLMHMIFGNDKGVAYWSMLIRMNTVFNRHFFYNNGDYFNTKVIVDMIIADFIDPTYSQV